MLQQFQIIRSMKKLDAIVAIYVEIIYKGNLLL